MEVKKISTLKGDLFTTELDDRLQDIVNRATVATGFPVALISVVIQRTTFYRAFVGLDKDLVKLRSTDTCATFCQYVVKNKKPLSIVDAKKEPALPQQLINLYGIRAYHGVPLDVDGEVIASLCVVDSKPNDLAAERKTALHELGKEASLRLQEITRKSAKAWPILEEVKYGKEKDVWNEIVLARDEMRVALAGLYPVTKYVSELSKGEGQGHPVVGAIQEATGCYDDLKQAMLRMDNLLLRLKKEMKS